MPNLKVHSIPKLIMQTWKDDNVPDKWLPSVQSIKTVMPDHKYTLMTDESNRELVDKHFPDFLSYYDAFEYNIQRADAIRACYLYLYGGIYMDLDFIVQRPLDELFDNKNELYFVPSGNLSSSFTNSLMASVPKHPFWLDYIEEMKKPYPHYAYGKHLKVMNSTGPVALTRVIRRHGGVIGYLPTTLVMPCSVCDKTCNVPDAYLAPLEGQSWNEWDSHFFNWWLCNWRDGIIYIAIVVLIIIAILIAWIYK